jgi:hypothetical protein
LANPTGRKSISAATALNDAAAAADRGDAFAALDLVRLAVASPERLGEHWAPAVKLCSRVGDDDAALLAARRLYEETPHSTQTAYILARTLEATGRVHEAIAVLVPVARAGQMTLHELLRLARLHLFAGQFDLAEALCRRLLRDDPWNPGVWQQLAQGRRFAPGDADLGPLSELQRRLASAPPGPRARAAWAWAKAMVDVGDDQAAALALEAAAALRTKLAVIDIESLEGSWRSSVDALPFGLLDAATGSAGERATFILGPQRSGTTLVDQILTNHPSVAGGGELGLLPLMRHVLGDFSGPPLSAWLERQRAAGTADPWAPIRERYFALADERFGPGSRFDDKLLSNHYRLAVIRCAFPGAKVIRLRRDPLDVAWSCWRANFPLESAWTSSPQWLAAYLASYERIMDTWCARHPRWILEVDYARLVSEPDREIPRILEFCGLPDHPATRSPHLNPRVVSTSSFAQVREPIHSGRVGSTRDFPRATAPLRAALAAEGLQFADPS